MAMAVVRKRATNKDQQRTEKMEEGLKKLEEETREETMRLSEEIGREEGQEANEEDERIQVAPNMEVGGSYLLSMTDPEEGKAEEDKRGTRKLRWADSDDNGEEEGRQEIAKEGHREVDRLQR